MAWARSRVTHARAASGSLTIFGGRSLPPVNTSLLLKFDQQLRKVPKPDLLQLDAALEHDLLDGLDRLVPRGAGLEMVPAVGGDAGSKRQSTHQIRTPASLPASLPASNLHRELNIYVVVQPGLFARAGYRA